MFSPRKEEVASYVLDEKITNIGYDRLIRIRGNLFILHVNTITPNYDGRPLCICAANQYRSFWTGCTYMDTGAGSTSGCPLAGDNVKCNQKPASR